MEPLQTTPAVPQLNSFGLVDPSAHHEPALQGPEHSDDVSFVVLP